MTSILRQSVVQKSLKMLNIWSFTGGSGDPSLDTQLVRLASQVIPEFLFEKDILWKQHILHYHAQVDKVCVTKGKCVHEKMFWWKYVLMKLKHIFLSTSQNFKVFDVIKIYLHLFVKCLYLFLWTVEKIYIWCLDKYFCLFFDPLKNIFDYKSRGRPRVLAGVPSSILDIVLHHQAVWPTIDVHLH